MNGRHSRGPLHAALDLKRHRWCSCVQAFRLSWPTDLVRSRERFVVRRRQAIRARLRALTRLPHIRSQYRTKRR